MLLLFVFTEETRKQTPLDRGQTDRMSLPHDLDLDLQSPASCGHDLLMCKSSRLSVSHIGQSLQKIEWKQMDGSDCIN